MCYYYGESNCNPNILPICLNYGFCDILQLFFDIISCALFCKGKWSNNLLFITLKWNQIKFIMNYSYSLYWYTFKNRIIIINCINGIHYSCTTEFTICIRYSRFLLNFLTALIFCSFSIRSFLYCYKFKFLFLNCCSNSCLSYGLTHSNLASWLSKQ